MCGICGFHNCEGSARLDTMLNRLVHRGPDEGGRHVEEGVGIGIRRLSIIDVDGGHQPVANERGTVRVVQNGEIYNYRDLREELQRKGHRFSSNSDTEVIVHLYEEEGEEMVHRLRGMFAIAVWDREKRQLLLYRDRLGIKPLYYVSYRGGLLFASELDALRAALPALSLRKQAIADFLTFLYVPGPQTIYEGVSELLPGNLLKCHGPRQTARRYYDLREAARRTEGVRTAGELQEEFNAVLEETVERHLVSDVPLGLFLSGGLDSGAMLAMMRRITDGPIRTFSIGYEDEADREFNETSSARMMANRFGAEHTEELLRPNAAQLLHNVVAAMGEPFADSSALPTYLVSEMARRNVTVALSGVGGDEMFGGYPRYLGAEAVRHYGRIPRAGRRLMAALITRFVRERGGHRDYAARLKRFVRSGLEPLDRQYVDWITFLPPEWGGDALAPAFAAEIDLDYRRECAMETFAQWPLPRPGDKAMGLDIQTYLPDDLLKMGDRMSMAHSLELRVPFCDHRIYEFALRVPTRLRLAGWRLKSFMRRSLVDALPKEVTAGAKRGFMLPIARWLREDLREMVGDVLSESAVKSRGYIQPRYVKWLVSEHSSGRRNLSDQLVALLVLELWLRQNESKGVVA